MRVWCAHALLCFRSFVVGDWEGRPCLDHNWKRRTKQQRTTINKYTIHISAFEGGVVRWYFARLSPTSLENVIGRKRKRRICRWGECMKGMTGYRW
ncbi:MAG: hypothetical protein JOS17DRAFT_254411 [Linnemannia elongata]|nr:MAG: hypothetical protein JOS17DRAFT_254411 [Linnemannia elongata]